MWNKKGILIYNASLQGEKFTSLHQWYIESAMSEGIALSLCSTLELQVMIKESKVEEQLACDFVLFLDKDVHLAQLLEKKGIHVFNSSEVIRICDDKKSTYTTLLGSDVTLIDTIFAPLLFKEATMDTYYDWVEEQLGYPFVVKAAQGSFGEQVHKVDSREMFLQLELQYATTSRLYQRFMDAKGIDYRLFTVGQEVVCTVKRENKYDFRANVTNGGIMSVISCKEEMKRIALSCVTTLQADFLGIDLLEVDGVYYVCEINSNAHSYNAFLATGISVPSKIFEWILKCLG